MRKFFGFVAFTVAMVVAFYSSAFPQTVIETVTENDVVRLTEGATPSANTKWVLYSRMGTPNTAATFMVGPENSPLGVGSLELKTVAGTEKVFLFNFEHVGTKLSEISAISYSTYRKIGSLQQVAALNMVIDFNGPDVEGGFATLVFEPVYNTEQGAVVSGVWQTWNAFGSGIWWSTRDINGQCTGATAACDKTWTEIVTNNPDAVILGGFGINQGSGNPGLTTSVDALTLGTSPTDQVIYNFDPYKVAEVASQCKNGGYSSVKRADGSNFKNQGDCVSYVNTGN